MKTLTDHLIEGFDAAPTIKASESGHRYLISGFSTYKNKYRLETPVVDSEEVCDIIFQDGPVPEKGHNGITLECLLVICKDRLEMFQSGKFPCKENAVALDHINIALNSLKSRTKNRLDRGVEGKDIK